MSGESKPVAANLAQFDIDAFRRLSSLNARDLADVIAYLSNARSLDHGQGQQPRAFVVDGFEVTAQGTPNMTVAIGFGLGGAPASGSSGVVGSPQKTEDSNLAIVNKRLVTTAQAITAADPAAYRFDLIEVGPTASPTTVGVDEQKITMNWSDAANDFVPSGGPVTVMQHGEPDVFYTAGAVGANGVVAMTAGRIPIAVVRVQAAATTITQADILDVRPFLADLLRAHADSQSELQVGELTMDVATSSTDAQTMGVQVKARVGGIPCSFQTHVPVDTKGNDATGGHVYPFINPSDHGALAAYTGWVYCYLVASDDKGYRYSRAHVTHATSALEVPVNGDFSHCGVLAWSQVAPSLANGSLAPGAAITLPNAYGATTCGAVGSLGKAVCVGAAYWTGNHFSHGLRMLDGKATLLESTAPTGIGTWTLVAEANGGGNTTISAIYAVLTNSSVTNPWGALSLDLGIAFAVKEPQTHPNVPRSFAAFEMGVGGPGAIYAQRALASIPPRTAGPAAVVDALLLRDVAIYRIPQQRGASQQGVYILETANYAAPTTGDGFVDPASTAPLTYTHGYRWPQGSIVV